MVGLGRTGQLASESGSRVVVVGVGVEVVSLLLLLCTD